MIDIPFRSSDRAPLDEHERARIEALRRLVAAREKALLRERHACKDICCPPVLYEIHFLRRPPSSSTYHLSLFVCISKRHREGCFTDGLAAGGELAAQVATSGTSKAAGRTWTTASGRAPRANARYACTSRRASECLGMVHWRRNYLVVMAMNR